MFAYPGLQSMRETKASLKPRRNLEAGAGAKTMRGSPRWHAPQDLLSLPDKGNSEEVSYENRKQDSRN